MDRQITLRVLLHQTSKGADTKTKTAQLRVKIPYPSRFDILPKLACIQLALRKHFDIPDRFKAYIYVQSTSKEFQSINDEEMWQNALNIALLVSSVDVIDVLVSPKHRFRAEKDSNLDVSAFDFHTCPEIEVKLQPVPIEPKFELATGVAHSKIDNVRPAETLDAIDLSGQVAAHFARNDPANPVEPPNQVESTDKIDLKNGVELADSAAVVESIDLPAQADLAECVETVDKTDLTPLGDAESIKNIAEIALSGQDDIVGTIGRIDQVHSANHEVGKLTENYLNLDKLEENEEMSLSGNHTENDLISNGKEKGDNVTSTSAQNQIADDSYVNAKVGENVEVSPNAPEETKAWVAKSRGQFLLDTEDPQDLGVPSFPCGGSTEQIRKPESVYSISEYHANVEAKSEAKTEANFGSPEKSTDRLFDEKFTMLTCEIENKKAKIKRIFSSMAKHGNWNRVSKELETKLDEFVSDSLADMELNLMKNFSKELIEVREEEKIQVDGYVLRNKQVQAKTVLENLKAALENVQSLVQSLSVQEVLVPNFYSSNESLEPEAKKMKTDD